MKDKYKNYLIGMYPSHTGTVNAYMKAMDIIDFVLSDSDDEIEINCSIWDIRDIQKLNEILVFVDQESKKNSGGVFRKAKGKTSYWKKGFCRAALKAYIRFIDFSS